MRLPQKLLATTPGWIVETDVVVVGSGIAGLTTALRVAGLGPGGTPTWLRVMVVTKDVLSSGSTRRAQVGIAAVLGPDDTQDGLPRCGLLVWDRPFTGPGCGSWS